MKGERFDENHQTLGNGGDGRCGLGTCRLRRRGFAPDGTRSGADSRSRRCHGGGERSQDGLGKRGYGCGRSRNQQVCRSGVLRAGSRGGTACHGRLCGGQGGKRCCGGNDRHGRRSGAAGYGCSRAGEGGGRTDQRHDVCADGCGCACSSACGCGSRTAGSRRSRTAGSRRSRAAGRSRAPGSRSRACGTHSRSDGGRHGCGCGGDGGLFRPGGSPGGLEHRGFRPGLVRYGA